MYGKERRRKTAEEAGENEKIERKRKREREAAEQVDTHRGIYWNT